MVRHQFINDFENGSFGSQEHFHSIVVNRVGPWFQVVETPIWKVLVAKQVVQQEWKKFSQLLEKNKRRHFQLDRSTNPKWHFSYIVWNFSEFSNCSPYSLRNLFLILQPFYYPGTQFTKIRYIAISKLSFSIQWKWS